MPRLLRLLRLPMRPTPRPSSRSTAILRRKRAGYREVAVLIERGYLPAELVLENEGENPAHIHVGDTYNDLGATITGPTETDKNLGIKTYLNGTLVSDIVLDTSTTTTNTMDYVATDANGLTSTSIRTVLIEAPSAELRSSSPATSTATI